METRLVQCATCGAELDVGSGRCPSCEAKGPVPAGAVPEAPRGTAPDERALGLALFEAEECLARGSPDKAVVLASKAVKDRPDSLTARALLDRARRELLRGRRRERLEARVEQASQLVEGGDIDGAERIVTSALKLIPDHALALGLFARIKERRLGAGTAEAEALRELERIGHARAEKALVAARAALSGGWARKAFLALRQGLRDAPGHPELLALLREAQSSLEQLDLERTRRRALSAQVRAGLDLVARGQLDDSLLILRAVLREDPDNARAQAAVQQVRQVWLTRVEFASATGRAVATTQPQPADLRAASAPAPSGPAPRERAPRPLAGSRVPGPAGASRIPVEIRLPATRRRATPMALVLGCGAAIVAVMAWFVFGSRGSRTPAPVVTPASSGSEAAAGTGAARAPRPSAPGPLTDVSPGLRAAVELRLARYARALETADAALLEAARPDLSPEQRRRALEPFRDALNAASDLRVLRADERGDTAEVVLLRSDFIVGRPTTPPVEETLRFRRERGDWVLR